MPINLDNPVLDAYMKGVQLKNQKNQTEFENKLQEEQSKRAETQLKAYTENLKAEQEHRHALLDIEKTKIGLEAQSHQLQARKMIGEMISSGQMRPQTPEQANSSPVGGIDLGGGQIIDPRQFASPQDMLNLDAQRASRLGEVAATNEGKAAGAKASAMQPYQLFQLKQQHANEMEKQATANKSALANTMAHVEGQKAVARINGQYDLYKVRLQTTLGITDPAQWAATVLPYATGEAQKPLGNTPRDMAIRQHLNAMGQKEFTAKEHEKLTNLRLLDPVFNMMDEFVANAPTTKAGAGGQLVISKIPTTDLNNFKARIRSMGGTIAAGLDQQSGRMANQEIERVLGGLAVPGKTLEQAKQDVSMLRSRYSSKALDSIMGGIPDKQKLLILKNNQFNPGVFTTNYNGKEIPRYKQDADGEWLVFNPSRRGYESLDAAGK